MIQSLVRSGRVHDLVAGYGHVIVDECHHIPAISFERVLSETWRFRLSSRPIARWGIPRKTFLPAEASFLARDLLEDLFVLGHRVICGGERG